MDGESFSVIFIPSVHSLHLWWLLLQDIVNIINLQSNLVL